MTQTAKHYYTPEEYLALEAKSDRKHEYYRGQIYLMFGAQPVHNRVAGGLYALLFAGLRGNPCEPFNSDQRVYISANGLYTYPDVSVACEAEFATVNGLDSLTNPIVIIEVLSETTKDYDRTNKFELYKALPSLQNYILVEQDRPYIQCFVRQDPFWYIQTVQGLDQDLHIPALNLDVPVADIYERVTLPEPTDAHPPVE